MNKKQIRADVQTASQRHREQSECSRGTSLSVWCSSAMKQQFVQPIDANRSDQRQVYVSNGLCAFRAIRCLIAHQQKPSCATKSARSLRHARQPLLLPWHIILTCDCERYADRRSGWAQPTGTQLPGYFWLERLLCGELTSTRAATLQTLHQSVLTTLASRHLIAGGGIYLTKSDGKRTHLCIQRFDHGQQLAVIHCPSGPFGLRHHCISLSDKHFAVAIAHSMCRDASIAGPDITGPYLPQTWSIKLGAKLENTQLLSFIDNCHLLAACAHRSLLVTDLAHLAHLVTDLAHYACGAGLTFESQALSKVKPANSHTKSQLIFSNIWLTVGACCMSSVDAHVSACSTAG